MPPLKSFYQRCPELARVSEFWEKRRCASKYFITLIFVYLLTVQQIMTEDGNIDVPVAEGLLTSRRNVHYRYSKYCTQASYPKLKENYS